MKKNMTNEAFVTGYIYSHDLKEKVTGSTSKNPGTEFIQGTLNIVTDNAGLNVVPILLQLCNCYYQEWWPQ